MTPRSVLAVLPLIFLPAACTPIVKTAEPGTLYVDPTVELGSISPYLYGSNYGPAHTVPMDMVPFVMDAGFTVLRFPGGAWGDNIDLPHIQIDQFVAFYTQMGALPTMSVGLLGGTPEKAAELGRYTNKEMKSGVVYWSIGNEPNLYASQSPNGPVTVQNPEITLADGRVKWST